MRLVLLALLTVPLAATAASQPRLTFEAEAHDFGRIVEGDGAARTTFRFTNTGDAPLRLTRVEAACGCTTPRWTDGEVAPGGDGVVEVAYDPAGRPGPFDKTILVDAEGVAPVVLRVEGVVEPALARTGVRIGSLAFRETTVDAGVVPRGEPLQTSFQFANVGDRPVRIERVEAPDDMEVVAPPRAVFPDGLGGLFVTVSNLEALAIDGRVEIEFPVYTTDADEPVKRLRVIGRVAAE